MSARDTRHKVLIIGGGPAGLAAAHALTDPCHEKRFEVTVMQRGWRLGGKGASGRNQDDHDRIEEHGLHLWFGFYDRAFKLMQDVHRDLDPESPDAWCEDFSPVKRLGFWRRESPDKHAVFEVQLPARELKHRGTGPPEDVTYVRAFAGWFRTLWRAHEATYPGIASAGPSPIGPLPQAIEDVLGPPDPSIWHTQRNVLEWGAGKLQDAADDIFAREDQARAGAKLKGPLPKVPETLRVLGQLCDFFGGLFLGALDSEAFVGGESLLSRLRLAPDLSHLDQSDAREWLEQYLRRPETTLGAPFLRALYDLVFAYPDGVRKEDGTTGRLAAGVGLRGIFNIAFHHRGTVMFRMCGGMGDVIFAPLYRSLHKRCVTFKFFSAVTRVRVVDGRIEVAWVPQVELAGERTEYEPLISVHERDAWPNRPRCEQIAPADWERLEECGADLERDREANPLKRDTVHWRQGQGQEFDFDSVILAVPIEEAAVVCTSLAGDAPGLAAAIEAKATVATQALQLWLANPPRSVTGLAVNGGFDPPWDTYADMSHVLPHESWGDTAPRQVAYFCGALDQSYARGGQAAADAAVRQMADEHLAQRLSQEAAAPDHVIARYTRANIALSERYSLSLPGMIGDRVPPGGTGLRHLAVAGDWTSTCINAGCIEAAVESGQAAADAIVGWSREA